MSAIELKLNLPDDLEHEARSAGLLAPERIEAWLRSELRQVRVDQLFLAMDRVADQQGAAMTTEEIQAEIAAARAERPCHDANRP